MEGYRREARAMKAWMDFVKDDICKKAVNADSLAAIEM